MHGFEALFPNGSGRFYQLMWTDLLAFSAADSA
jgi:hypothetical protein